MSNKNKQTTRVVEILIWATLIGFNVFGAIGLLLVLYGFAHEKVPERYSLGIVDDTIVVVSQVMALVGVITITYSIYIPVNRMKPQRKPHPGSKYITVPLIMTPLLMLGIYRFVVDGYLPALVINGYVLLGIAGTVFRLLPVTLRSTDEI